MSEPKKNRIKSLKPKDPAKRKKGDPKSGYFDTSKSTKYTNSDPCIYRSGLELDIFSMFENSDVYLAWESEPNLGIKYMFGDKQRTYYVDAIFEHKSMGKYLCEIKPFTQTVLPKMGKNRNQVTYDRAMVTYEQNLAKWTAASKYASEHGFKFCILTEKFLKNG